MAKETNGSKFRLISTIIGMLVLFSGLVSTWAVYGKDIEANKAETIELKAEGCVPGKQASIDMTLVKYRLDSIDDQQAEFSTEQQAMRKDNRAFQQEVLRRLPQ